MKNNVELQIDVQNAIKWNPLLHDEEIGVRAKDGVVFLTGVLDCCAKKTEVEKVSKNVIGVIALVENLIIQFPSSWKKSDAKIMQEVKMALQSDWSIPNDKITVKVKDAWVTLEGELLWNYQKEAAVNALNDIIGLRGITNNIHIKEEIHDALEKKDVEDAIDQSCLMDDCDIHVLVSGTTVTLTGTVNSWNQKEIASSLAQNTAGIWHVKNELVVDYYYALLNQ